MVPLGHVAGTASAVLGFCTFTGGAVLGGMVGYFFNGTVTPLSASFMIFGLAAIAILFVTERGVLFRDVDS